MGATIRLPITITQKSMNSFDDIVTRMMGCGMKVPVENFRINIPDSLKILDDALTVFLKIKNETYTRLPEYAKVAEWLEDNQGRGLFLYGNCGRGKTLLARYVIPAIMLRYYGKVVGVYDMNEVNTKIDEVIKRRFISIDDVGTESESVVFGERRMAFSEIMDAAEKRGILLIISTNLNHDDIKKRYGDRVFDRIVATTKRVAFQGQSLRH